MRRKASGATPFELADGASCSVRLCFPTAGAAGSGEHCCRAGAGKAPPPSPASTRKKAAPPQGRMGVRPWPSAARDGRGVRPGGFGVVEGTVGERGPVEGREQVGKGSERRKNGERTEGCRAGVGPFVRFGRKMLRKGNFYSDVDPFGVFFRGSFWFFRRIDYICRSASAENQIRAAL